MPSSPAPHDIAVIGGGFSGLMVIANAIRNSPRRLRILWADESGRFARGTAYATTEDIHLLNVPAGKMGAWADRPEDFLGWLRGRYGADAFAPRRVYGDYLDGIADEVAGQADIERMTAAADGVETTEGGFVVRFADGARAAAKALVLATGNPPCRDPGWPENDLYVADFWRWRLGGGRLTNVAADATVVIAGAGLTTADAVLGLRRDGFAGRIVAVSPHGWLPRAHAPADEGDFSGMIRDLRARPAAAAYLRRLRGEANWRAAVDALRPHTVDLWQALDEREKARALRHLLSLWNVRRHRMAPEIAAQLSADKNFTVTAGRIATAAADGTVTIRPRGGAPARPVRAAKIINCTGPSYRGLIAGNPLLADLLRQGLVRPGPLGFGIATPVTPGLFAIGTPLIGERLETTAVPDLRGQAADVAEKILKLI